MLYCHTTSKIYCPLGLIMGRFPSDFLMCGHPPSSKPQWQLDPLIFSGLEFFKTFFNFKIQRAVQTFLVLVLCTCGWAIVAIFQSSSARKYLFFDDKKLLEFCTDMLVDEKKMLTFCTNIFNLSHLCHQSWFPNSQELCSKWGDYKEGTFKEMELSNFFCQAVCNILVKL